VKHKRKKGQSGKIPSRPTKLPAQPKTKRKKSFLSVISYPFRWVQSNAVFASFCVLIGLVASIASFFTLAPRLQITPSGLLAPQNAFSTQFEVSNSGFLEAEDIYPLCKFSVEEPSLNISIKDMLVALPGFTIHRLKGGDKTTFSLNERYMTWVKLQAAQILRSHWGIK
jgi:hypothetical protein